MMPVEDEQQNSPEDKEYDSVDPAPPSKNRSIGELRSVLCDENSRMFQRMRALFTLRNIGGQEAIDALVASFASASVLLKHEVAYVLGQMQDSYAIDALIERLADGEEDSIVRHEAAEALGAIGDTRSLGVLKQYLNDDCVIVSESCEVALDLLEWTTNDSLEYE